MKNIFKVLNQPISTPLKVIRLRVFTLNSLNLKYATSKCILGRNSREHRSPTDDLILYSREVGCFHSCPFHNAHSRLFPFPRLPEVDQYHLWPTGPNFQGKNRHFYVLLCAILFKRDKFKFCLILIFYSLKIFLKCNRQKIY